MDQVVDKIGLRPLAPGVGVEVTGVDLSSLSPGDGEFILNAYKDHSAILFRGQDLSPRALLAFAEIFGQPDTAPMEQRSKTVEGEPQVYVISNIKNDKGKAVGSLGNVEADWHADQTNHEVPPGATLLYAVELPPTGGDTSVASMFTALENMPASLRDKIEGRRIKHDGTYNSGGFLRKGAEETGNPMTDPGVLHPAIIVHEESGRPVLFLGRRRNSYIEGYELEESEAVLDELWAHVTKPEFAYTHQWKLGDLLLWNNRSTLHRRDAFDPSHRRKMLRVQIQGADVPVAA